MSYPFREEVLRKAETSVTIPAATKATESDTIDVIGQLLVLLIFILASFFIFMTMVGLTAEPVKGGLV